MACFEADYVQSSIATLRHWVLTGKESNRPDALLAAKQDASVKVLRILEGHFAKHDFLLGQDYSIADIAIFAYCHRADEAGIATAEFPAFVKWAERAKNHDGFFAPQFNYDIDPQSWRELP